MRPNAREAGAGPHRAIARLCAVPLAGAALLALALPAAARPAGRSEPAETRAPSHTVADLAACRAMADPGARLACFDKAAGSLLDAVNAKDVLVVDRATVRETKRHLFGLSLPSVHLFGDSDDEEVDHVDSKLAGEYVGRDGAQVFVLADGSRWRQTDGRDTFPRVGQPITIKKGTLGSFFAIVNGQPGVRAVRIQ